MAKIGEGRYVRQTKKEAPAPPKAPKPSPEEKRAEARLEAAERQIEERERRRGRVPLPPGPAKGPLRMAPKEREMRLFEPGREISLEREIREHFPWSAKGRQVIGGVQLSPVGPGLLAHPVTGELMSPAGLYIHRKAATPAWKATWDKLHRAIWRKPQLTGPAGEYAYGELPGVAAFKYTGETIPHEYAHAAADYPYGPVNLGGWSGAKFREDLLAWLDRKPDDPNKRLVRRFLEEQGLGEAYAVLGQAPQFIPGELQQWYPQFDFTRRRAMGVRQPLMPPPPPPAGPLRK